MSQESSASELEMAKEYSLVLAGTDDEDDRYLNAFCESIKQDKEYRKTSGFYNGVPSRQSQGESSTPQRKRHATTPTTASTSGGRKAKRQCSVSKDAAVSDADESSRFDFAVVKYRPLLGSDEDEDEWVSSGRPISTGAAGASSSSATALVLERPSTEVLLARLRLAVERARRSDEERRLALLVLEKLETVCCIRASCRKAKGANQLKIRETHTPHAHAPHIACAKS